MMSDPISDFLIRIKNAGAVGKASVVMPYSKQKHAIADVLLRAGYIKGVSKKGKKVRKTLEVELLYTPNGAHKITDLSRVSKPSRRLYTNAKSIPSVQQGHGTLILSTPNGMLTDDEAREKHVGGEMLFKIW